MLVAVSLPVADLIVIPTNSTPSMKEPDPPKELPPQPYPERTCWWRFKRFFGYPREIVDWELFTWDDTPPDNRSTALREARRELRKPPQNILQDTLEQLDTDSDKRLECIQKSTITILAVSAYETRRATWWLQFLTWSLLALTMTLVLQTCKLISLETWKSSKDSSPHNPNSPSDPHKKQNGNNDSNKDLGGVIPPTAKG